jgi:hypothetical protein
MLRLLAVLGLQVKLEKGSYKWSFKRAKIFVLFFNICVKCQGVKTETDRIKELFFTIKKIY